MSPQKPAVSARFQYSCRGFPGFPVEVAPEFPPPAHCAVCGCFLRAEPDTYDNGTFSVQCQHCGHTHEEKAA